MSVGFLSGQDVLGPHVLLFRIAYGRPQVPQNLHVRKKHHAGHVPGLVHEGSKRVFMELALVYVVYRAPAILVPLESSRLVGFAVGCPFGQHDPDLSHELGIHLVHSGQIVLGHLHLRVVRCQPYALRQVSGGRVRTVERMPILGPSGAGDFARLSHDHVVERIGLGIRVFPRSIREVVETILYARNVGSEELVHGPRASRTHSDHALGHDGLPVKGSSGIARPNLTQRLASHPGTGIGKLLEGEISHSLRKGESWRGPGGFAQGFRIQNLGRLFEDGANLARHTCRNQIEKRYPARFLGTFRPDLVPDVVVVPGSCENLGVLPVDVQLIHRLRNFSRKLQGKRSHCPVGNRSRPHAAHQSRQSAAFESLELTGCRTRRGTEAQHFGSGVEVSGDERGKALHAQVDQCLRISPKQVAQHFSRAFQIGFPESLQCGRLGHVLHLIHYIDQPLELRHVGLVLHEHRGHVRHLGLKHTRLRGVHGSSPAVGGLDTLQGLVTEAFGNHSSQHALVCVLGCRLVLLEGLAVLSAVPVSEAHFGFHAGFLGSEQGLHHLGDV